MAPARGVPVNGAAVRAIREALGIKLSTLATDTLLSTGYLSNVEHGKKPRVSPEVRRRLADRLQCTVDAIAYTGADQDIAS
jgi:transcriptional regulator with XRE-family HTH domain